MTENRFLLEGSDFDLKYEFRVADLSRVEKTKEDFWNEKEEKYDYFDYIEYLYENNAFLTEEDADKTFNGLHKENKELQHKLSQQEMEYTTDLYRLVEENEQLKKEKEFWKSDACSLSSLNSILSNELSIAQEQGYEPSTPYKEYITSIKTEYDKFWENKIKTHNNRLKELQRND